jgi:hypothetical protein
VLSTVVIVWITQCSYCYPTCRSRRASTKRTCSFVGRNFRAMFVLEVKTHSLHLVETMSLLHTHALKNIVTEERSAFFASGKSRASQHHGHHGYMIIQERKLGITCVAYQNEYFATALTLFTWASLFGKCCASPTTRWLSLYKFPYCV